MDNLVLPPVVKPDKNKLEDAYEVADDLSTECDGASDPWPDWLSIGMQIHLRFLTTAAFPDLLYHTNQVDREARNTLLHEPLLASGMRKSKAAPTPAAVESFGDRY